MRFLSSKALSDHFKWAFFTDIWKAALREHWIRLNALLYRWNFTFGQLCGLGQQLQRKQNSPGAEEGLVRLNTQTPSSRTPPKSGSCYCVVFFLPKFIFGDRPWQDPRPSWSSLCPCLPLVDSLRCVMFQKWLCPPVLPQYPFHPAVCCLDLYFKCRVIDGKFLSVHFFSGCLQMETRG